jgi:hypothetical protein
MFLRRLAVVLPHSRRFFSSNSNHDLAGAIDALNKVRFCCLEMLNPLFFTTEKSPQNDKYVELSITCLLLTVKCARSWYKGALPFFHENCGSVLSLYSIMKSILKKGREQCRIRTQDNMQN